MTQRADPAVVSVIVPVLNGAATLPRLFASLERQHYDGAWEVIVADNGSSDGSSALIPRWSGRLPGLRLVDASGRRGVSHARNMGVRAARGSLLVFIDTDDEADPGWLEALVRAARPSAFLTGRVVTDTLNAPEVRSWYSEEQTTRLLRSHEFLPYAIGTNVAIASEVLRGVGGWDESFVGGGEDIELSWRVQLAGHPLTFVPEAIVHKRRRQTLGQLARQQFRGGIASAGLYRKFRPYLRPHPMRASLNAWGAILLGTVDLFRSSGRRGRWVATTARRLGRLVGSVREGVFYP